MNDKSSMTFGPTTVQIVAKAQALLRTSNMRHGLTMNPQTLRLVVSHETYFEMVYEAKHGGTGAQITAHGDLRIWGVKLDREAGIPDLEVELRQVLGRSWV